MKRHIAIPLLCVVLVAALSFPVYADPYDSPTFPYPENHLSGSYTLNIGAVNFTEGYFPSLALSLDFGSLWTGKFFLDDPWEAIVVANMVLDVSVGGSLYIAVPSDYSSRDLNSTSLPPFRDAANDYDVVFSDNWTVTGYTPTNSSFVTSSTSSSLSVSFLAFDSVPAGSYDIRYSIYPHDDSVAVCFGVYASQGDFYSYITDQVIDGTISYVDGIDQIMSHYDESIKGVTDFQQLTVYALELGTALDRLNMSLSGTGADHVGALDSTLQNTVNSYTSGQIDIKEAIDAVASDYTSALSSAQTVEEATGLTATYQATLKELELRSQFKLMEGFDAVITDEEIQNANDYYAAEDELVNAFDVAEFDAQLQFDLWWLQMPRNETIAYKKFFDYLMNESDIKYFITIPLAMSLVAIIMGTRMRTRPDRVIERSTTVDSGGSRTTTVKYKND